MTDISPAAVEAFIAAARNGWTVQPSVLDMLQALSAERDRLAADNAELRALDDEAMHGAVALAEANGELKLTVTTLRATFERLCEAVIKYARHLSSCRSYGGHDCDCGRDDAIAAAKKEIKG